VNDPLQAERKDGRPAHAQTAAGRFPASLPGVGGGGMVAAGAARERRRVVDRLNHHQMTTETDT